MGPLEAVKPWQTSQMQGASGFGPLWLSWEQLLGNSWVDADRTAEPTSRGCPLGL
jgi:hypothetical protein